jgi:predicted MFS family arabinose efflux permease
LVVANARLDQADSAAQTLGPAIGGGLVGMCGAPVAIVIDAVSYLVDAALNASIRVHEPRPDSRTRDLRQEIGDGLRWTYRHHTLGPLAVSTHIWFFANGAALTVLSLLALRTLGLTAYAFGTLLAVFGITSLIGASLAPAIGDRFGSGRVVIFARVAYPSAWLLITLAPATGGGEVLLFTALGLLGLAAGLENANEMGYWQALTPHELLGRVNATRRSINQSMAASGALIGGLGIGLIGERASLAIAIVGFVTAALAVALSPLRQKPDHRDEEQ